jgi:hypothetical protein
LNIIVPPGRPIVNTTNVTSLNITAPFNITATEFTTAVANTGLQKREDHTLEVVIGSTPQHTGMTRGSRLYDQVYKALVEQCPGGGNIVECLRKGVAAPIGVDGLISSRKTGPVHFKVEVIESFWGPGNDALRLLMIGTVAAIVQAAADAGTTNCETRNNNGSTPSYYCNVPNWISVKPPIESGDKWTRLEVRITSDHIRNHYDCQGFLTPANNAVDPLLSEYATATHHQWVDRDLWCLSNTEGSTDLVGTLPGSSLIKRSDGTLNVVLGTGGQQTGHVRGSYLYHMVYETLLKLCPEHGTITRSGKCWSYTAYFSINAMDGTVKVPSSVGVTVDGSSHWDGKNNALRLLMIGTLAGIVEQASLIEDKNCRKIAGELFCNIPDFVHIKPSISDDSSLKVRFTNGLDMDQPRFDCVGLLTPANGQVDKYLPEYQIVLGKNNMDRNVWCAEDESKRDISLVDSSIQIRNNPVLTVEFGLRRTNFGKLHGSPMYGKVMDVIKLQCPQANGNCDHGRPSSFEVDSDNQKGHHTVTIEVLKAYWGDSAELWALMIGTIAGAQEQASLNPNNCKIKRLGYCNIAHFISIIVPPKKGSPSDTPTTKMDVQFTSKHEMAKTRFDCVGLLTPVNNIVDILMPGYTKYAGMDFERNVRCQTPASDEMDANTEFVDNLERAATVTFRPRKVDPINSTDLVLTRDVDRTIRVEVGTVAQNVGNLGANYLYDLIYKTFVDLCPVDNVMCTGTYTRRPRWISCREAIAKRYSCSVLKTSHQDTNLCLSPYCFAIILTNCANLGSWSLARKTTIKVERQLNDGKMDPKGGTLEIWVERSYWGPDNPLRLLFIGTIAKMLESGTLNGKTCQRTHDHTVCSIPHLVNIKTNGDCFFEARFHHKELTETTPLFHCVDQVKDLEGAVDLYKSYYEAALGGSLDRTVTCQHEKTKHCRFFFHKMCYWE